MMKILVNGTGLIGGSIIQDLKHSNLPVQVIGSDSNAANLRYLLKRRLIDQTADFLTAAPQADVIILATPVNIIIQNLKQLSKIDLKPHTLVTDVGSSKQLILNAAKSLMNQGIHFLGGHPFSGSHLTGSANGSWSLFRNRAYFLVNGNATSNEIGLFKRLMRSSGAKFKLISAEQHDQLLSFMSHLPHVVAFSLINTIAPQLHNMGISPQIGAGGIRDTTRIAMSSPEVWTAIFNSNSKLIIDQITRFEKQLEMFKTSIKTHNVKKLKSQIVKANRIRKIMEEG